MSYQTALVGNIFSPFMWVSDASEKKEEGTFEASYAATDRHS